VRGARSRKAVARVDAASLRTVRNLERLRSEHPTAPKSARLEARNSRLEARLGGGAALLVRELLLRRERHVQKHLRRQNQHVRRDAVPAHPVLTLLDSFVETHLLLLGDAVEHDLVVHSRLDVALRPQVLGAVCGRQGKVRLGEKSRSRGVVWEAVRVTVVEVVVGRRQVSVERVEV